MVLNEPVNLKEHRASETENHGQAVPTLEPVERFRGTCVQTRGRQRISADKIMTSYTEKLDPQEKSTRTGGDALLELILGERWLAEHFERRFSCTAGIPAWMPTADEALSEAWETLLPEWEEVRTQREPRNRVRALIANAFQSRRRRHHRREQILMAYKDEIG